MQIEVGVHYKPKTKDWSHRSFFSQQTMSTFQGINYAFQSTKIYFSKVKKAHFWNEIKVQIYKNKCTKSMEYIYSFSGLINAFWSKNETTLISLFCGKGCCRLKGLDGKQSKLNKINFSFSFPWSKTFVHEFPWWSPPLCLSAMSNGLLPPIWCQDY